MNAVASPVALHRPLPPEEAARADFYALLGRLFAAPPDANLVYFTFVNYTTLGYGDITPAERWRLLGPMTAMNGVLLFGWSTAVIFQVLRRTMLSDPRAQPLIRT